MALQQFYQCRVKAFQRALEQFKLETQAGIFVIEENRATKERFVFRMASCDTVGKPYFQRFNAASDKALDRKSVV